MPHPYFSHVAVGLSLLPAFLGTNALLRPEAVMKKARFPIPADVGSRELSKNMMRLFGSRNLAISYLIILNWYTGNERNLGLGLLAGVWMATVDGFIFGWQVSPGAGWKQWGYIPVVLGVSAGLLGYFE